MHEKLIRKPEIRDALLKDMAEAIDYFWKLHDSEPSTGFTPQSMSEYLLAFLEKKNWHGVRE